MTCAGGRFVRWFRDITLDDLPLVGGKNASLGELHRELSAAGSGCPMGSPSPPRPTGPSSRAAGSATASARCCGSNDLTQLTLGLDRDSALVAPLFDAVVRGLETIAAAEREPSLAPAQGMLGAPATSP